MVSDVSTDVVPLCVLVDLRNHIFQPLTRCKLSLRCFVLHPFLYPIKALMTSKLFIVNPMHKNLNFSLFFTFIYSYKTAQVRWTKQSTISLSM